MSKQDGSGRQVTAEPSDDLTATILHIDMDAFFASVELLERPDLVGKPVIVGHDSQRSVVTAATYEARKFGVNSAMPMSVALRRCPQAIVLQPHFARYTHFSGVVMGLLRDVTPMVEPLSIDEAFLDVSGALRLMGTPWQIATRLRERVYAETGLRASVGAAATKYVAKLASSRAKPDGLLVVPAASTVAFLHPQPVSALWGVGPKTEEQLTRLGLRTVGDVAEFPLDALARAIGPAMAGQVHELSWGRDPRSVSLEREEKSVGHETTFEYDVVEPETIHRSLLSLSDGVGVRLRRAGVQARTISIKLRFEDFTTITRSRTLADPRSVSLEREEKSVGHETTFEYDVVDPEIIHRSLLSLSDGVGVRLRRAGVQARTISIKLRFEDFTTITRSRTLADPTDLAKRIYEEARSLYDAANADRRPVRLIGVRGEQLTGETAALGLWDDDGAWRDAEYTVDAVADKFGQGAVKPAALLKNAPLRRYGHGDD